MGQTRRRSSIKKTPGRTPAPSPENDIHGESRHIVMDGEKATGNSSMEWSNDFSGGPDISQLVNLYEAKRRKQAKAIMSYIDSKIQRLYDSLIAQQNHVQTKLQIMEADFNEYASRQESFIKQLQQAFEEYSIGTHDVVNMYDNDTKKLQQAISDHEAKHQEQLKGIVEHAQAQISNLQHQMAGSVNGMRDTVETMFGKLPK